jgi:hypothetical protein
MPFFGRQLVLLFVLASPPMSHAETFEPRYIYIGRQVSESETLRIEPGSAKEAALAGILARWLFKEQIASHYSADAADPPVKPYVEMVAATLLRHLRPSENSTFALDDLSEFAHVSPESLGLVEPIEVVSATMFWDGGSQFLELRDARLNTLQVLIPNRVKSLQR